LAGRCPAERGRKYTGLEVGDTFTPNADIGAILRAGKPMIVKNFEGNFIRFVDPETGSVTWETIPKLLRAKQQGVTWTAEKATEQAGAQDVPPASAGVSPVQPPSPESTPTSARVAPAAANETKQPWEMTREEWANQSKLIDKPAIRASGKIFTGEHHGEAVEAALKAGALRRGEDGELIDTETGDRAGYSGDYANDNLDLFTLRGGGVVNRLQADGRFNVNATENLHEQFSTHRAAVEQALKAGRPVPPEVLADYPDLAPPAQAPAQRPTGEKPQAPVQPQPAGGAKAALPELHPDVHPSIVQDAWNTVAAEQPELAKQVKRILPLDNYKYPTANASYAPESGTLRVNVDKPLTPETLRHEFEHVAQAQRGEAKFREDFPSEEQFQAAVEKPAREATSSRLRPRGAVPLPQILEAARAGVRGIRERFAEIEHRYGSDLANKFARATTPNTEAESIIRFWEKNGGDPATLQKLRDLGEHLRAEQDIKLKGLPASGLKTLTPAQEAAIRADPKVQQAMKWWNTNVRPLINDIRTTHGLPMSKAGNLIDFFVNLPSEYGPANVAGGKTGTNLREAFTRAATGEGQYIADPREFFKSMLGYHLRTDATKQLIAAVKRDAVVPTGSVRVPTGSAGNPATFPKLPQGQFFQATIKGRVEDVMPVDLAKPGDPADYAYVPKRVGETLRNLRQPVMQGDTIIDKAMNAATTVGVTGSFAPHTVRMLLHSGTRMAESGQSVMAAVPWVGKAVAAYQRSGQMRDQQFGKAVQLLIDRTGADKGWGYGVKPPTTTVGKILKAAHEKLFNPETGIDPMNRRVVADSYLRLVLGNDRLNQLEKSVNAGRMSPIEASRQIEAALGPKDLQGMARYVNGTIGWSNAQTRSSWLNWASRAFPFVSSESGKIPREIAHVATAGINPAAIVRHLQAGRYGAAAGAATAMLAGGAAGTYALMNAINYANTKAQTGTGKFMWDNDRHHKFDVFIAPNWYLSNFDPMLARGARLLGVKEAANEGTAAAAGKGAALENINEVFTVLNSGLKLLFSGVSAAALDQPRELRLDDRGRLVKASASDFSPTSIGRNTISYLRRQITGGQGESAGAAVARDAAALAGLNVSHSTRSQAEQFLAEETAKSDYATAPEQRARLKLEHGYLDRLRAKDPKARGELMRDRGLSQDQKREVMRNAMLSPLKHHLKKTDVETAVKAWELMTDAEKRETRLQIHQKINNSELAPARKSELRKKLRAAA
jgi:hypothetical protein